MAFSWVEQLSFLWNLLHFRAIWKGTACMPCLLELRLLFASLFGVYEYKFPKWNIIQNIFQNMNNKEFLNIIKYLDIYILHILVEYVKPKIWKKYYYCIACLSACICKRMIDCTFHTILLFYVSWFDACCVRKEPVYYCLRFIWFKYFDKANFWNLRFERFVERLQIFKGKYCMSMKDKFTLK